MNLLQKNLLLLRNSHIIKILYLTHIVHLIILYKKINLIQYIIPFFQINHSYSV